MTETVKKIKITFGFSNYFQPTPEIIMKIAARFKAAAITVGGINLVSSAINDNQWASVIFTLLVTGGIEEISKLFGIKEEKEKQ
jgi:hypothetical protein